MNSPRRICEIYRNRGACAVLVAARDEVRRRARWYSPKLSWARLGPVSMFVAKLFKPQAPSLLLLSMPRSGSSWVGETLGRAQNALYLREPINQSCLARFRQIDLDPLVVYEVDASAVSEAFAQAAHKAFSGLPAFPPYVVRFPDQWDLGSRQKRRLVIKEVNPMACGWLLERYEVRVILLVRHPAAVALSYLSMGWLSRPVGREFGEHLGAAQRAALDDLIGYQDHRTVTYEELCADPTGTFRTLYEFAELNWDEESKSFVQKRSSGNDHRGRYHPYGTSRDSKGMIRAWVGQLSTEELVDLRAGYGAFDLPWYQAEEDWN